MDDNKKKGPARFLSGMRKTVHRVEDGILVSLLFAMILLGAAQIISRNLFQSGFVWGDVLVRILVLWVGLGGAMVASRGDRHISIDVVTRFLPQRAKEVTKGVVNFATAGLCLLVAWYALGFVKMEFEENIIAFAKVPAWLCESIIPLAFGVMGLRYFILSVSNFLEFLKPRL